MCLEEGLGAIRAHAYNAIGSLLNEYDGVVGIRHSEGLYELTICTGTFA